MASLHKNDMLQGRLFNEVYIVFALRLFCCWSLLLFNKRKVRYKVHYSQVPIKQVGPNNRVGWIF